MKIVVTGASGFLGRALMHCLSDKSLSVLGVSRSQSPFTLQVKNYKDSPEGDVLVHLAETNDRAYAQSNTPYYQQDALATLNILLDKKFSRVIYASSALLYGDQGQLSRKVNDPVYETDAYTSLKLASESQVLGRNGVVVRLGNLYGPGMAKTNVISTILKQIPLDGPIRVFDANPVRDFLWVADAACALANMIRGEAYGIFNVGSGVGVSIHKLAIEILNATGQPERQIESSEPGKRFSKLVLDISETEAAFGWKPTINLVDGINALMKMSIINE